MIVGHIRNLENEKYRFPASIKKALHFLKEQNLSKLNDGKYEIDGEKNFAMVSSYMSKERSECRAETHRKYIDVQFIVEGEELMGYCALNPVLEIEEDCAEERDAIFYKALIPESDIILSQGMYAVIYPHDVHRPCCFLDQPQRVKKVVIKVSIDTLEK